MARLIPFEFSKIWRKRSFALSVCVLLSLHLFLMWYHSLPGEWTPPLVAYKELQAELSGKSEEEKGKRIAKYKETIDGVCLVQDILAMQSFENEMGNALAEQEMRDNPGVFERYYGLYESGGYLKFTDSIEQERAFVDEIYEEWQKVAGYGEYLRLVQENKNTLGEVSIFGGQTRDTYSSRNLEKSAADYERLSDRQIRFVPSKGLTLAMESVWIDLFLFLGTMLFVGSLITEEKEKRLFFITRSTKYGMVHSMASKLAALLIHCVLLTVLFYLASLVFFGQSTGGFDLTAGLQSAAVYMESSLSVSILGYIVLSVLTKAFLLFGIGAWLTVFCILFRIAALPFLVGAGIAGGSALLYYLIPSGSVFAIFQYMNPVGLMKTENLYGGYLNFNLFGYPVSRLHLSLLLILLIGAAGVGVSLPLFCRMKNFELRKLQLPFFVPFCPHTNILRHEAYKILVTNRAGFLLLLFAALLAYRSLDRTYAPSTFEQYYGDLMTELEGGITEEKEKLILSEQARYEEAFRQIERIDAMAAAGDLSDDAADSLKAQANLTLAFYPSFCRVRQQYEHIKAYGGNFIYDTGYRYLFGILEDAFPVDFLILSVGIILAASGAAPMEYQSGSLLLLCATKAGRQKILFRKVFVCGIAAAMLALIPVLCRAYRISSVYPIRVFGADIWNVYPVTGFFASVPLGWFLLAFVLAQLLAAVLTALSTMALSVWRKDQAQTIFFGLLILVVPMVLNLLGFEITKWFSLYPLYGWTGMAPAL